MQSFKKEVLRYKKYTEFTAVLPLSLQHILPVVKQGLTSYMKSGKKETILCWYSFVIEILQNLKPVQFRFFPVLSNTFLHSHFSTLQNTVGSRPHWGCCHMPLVLNYDDDDDGIIYVLIAVLIITGTKKDCENWIGKQGNC